MPVEKTLKGLGTRAVDRISKPSHKTTYVYAYTQQQALDKFRKEFNKKYTPISASYAGTKRGMKTYQIRYRLKKR